jgi:hypothetical protein
LHMAMYGSTILTAKACAWTGKAYFLYLSVSISKLNGLPWRGLIFQILAPCLEASYRSRYTASLYFQRHFGAFTERFRFYTHQSPLSRALFEVLKFFCD